MNEEELLDGFFAGKNWVYRKLKQEIEFKNITTMEQIMEFVKAGLEEGGENNEM